ncbi:MAG: hypothetical protein EXR62_06475 [Chloroflexi bacterium]|nr:hypothetical protein [Chloroflexota bacterium]
MFSIEHFAIASQDTDKLAQWYMDKLGFSVIMRTEAKPSIYFIKAPKGGLIEIIPANEKQIPQALDDDAGMRHVAFLYDDYDAAKKDLNAKGIELFNEFTAATGARIAWFRDPDGNLLQIVKRPKPLV